MIVEMPTIRERTRGKQGRIGGQIILALIPIGVLVAKRARPECLLLVPELVAHKVEPSGRR